jgi:hypothetical protein
MKATGFGCPAQRAFRWVGYLLASLLLSTALAQTSGKPVNVEMRNVMYHFSDSVAVHIRRLEGQLEPKGELPVFDDKQSFTLQISAAEIAMSPDNFADVLNSYVFAAHDAPLKNISIRIENDRLKIKGKLHSKGDVSFETEGHLSNTPDGKIRLHTEKIKALHLPAKGIMDLLGVKISDLINTGKVRGVSIDKDDLILDPSTLLPPPHISAHVTAVRLEPNNIVQFFGPAAALKKAPTFNGNFMAYRGNQLRFGKLTMSDTDMVLIDMDAKDPFDFYLDHYKEQLVAGYTKETPSFGLRVFMRDYNKLPHPNHAHAAQSKPSRAPSR